MPLDLPLFIIECVIIGGLAGLVYGIFGGGSGLVMVPGFYYLLRHFSTIQAYQMQVAIASCGAAVVLLGSVVAYMQWRQGNMNGAINKIMFPGLFVGSLTAIGLLNIIPSNFVKHLFSVMVIGIAIWFWYYRQEQDKTKWALSSWFNHIFTFWMGFLWFLIGVPVFIVPYLYKCGVHLRRAIGCMSFLGVSLSTIGVILFVITGLFHFPLADGQLGFINLYIVGFTILPSVVMALVGVKLGSVIPKTYLQKMYAALVFTVGVIMLF